LDQDELNALLQQSDAFQEHLVEVLNDAHAMESSRIAAVWPLVVVVHEHSAAIRLLIEGGLGASALALLRVLYDAVVRQMWAGYCASAEQLARLNADLSPESFHSSQVLPSTHEMLDDLEKRGPVGLHNLLHQFKAQSSKPLNSVIHSGLHAVHLANVGLFIPIAGQVIKQTNNLLHMSGLQAAEIAQCQQSYDLVGVMYKQYKDCFQLQ
jgi:hypothetical protein